MSKQAKQIIAVLIAINLLFLGAISGHLIKGAVVSVQGSTVFLPPLPQEALFLPEDKQRLFQEKMKETQAKNEALKEEIDAQRMVIVEAMTADVFDETIYQAAAQKLHDLRGQQMQNLADAAKDLAKQFSIQERVILAQLLRRSSPPSGPPTRPEEGGVGPGPGGPSQGYDDHRPPPPPHQGGPGYQRPPPPPHHGGPGHRRPPPF